VTAVVEGTEVMGWFSKKQEPASTPERVDEYAWLDAWFDDAFEDFDDMNLDDSDKVGFLRSTLIFNDDDRVSAMEIRELAYHAVDRGYCTRAFADYWIEEWPKPFSLGFGG
jgi:hypothetical protein